MPLRCPECGRFVAHLNEADQCDQCYQTWADEEMARLFPIYQAERLLARQYEDFRHENV